MTWSRAGGLHSRTVEALDQRGVADRFVTAGQTHPSIRYGQSRLDISDFPTRHSELLSMDEPRRYLAGMLSGLDVHYDIGEGHPLLGRRMPDLDLQTADGPARVFARLHNAQSLRRLRCWSGPTAMSPGPTVPATRRCTAHPGSHRGTLTSPLLAAMRKPAPAGKIRWCAVRDSG